MQKIVHISAVMADQEIDRLIPVHDPQTAQEARAFLGRSRHSLHPRRAELEQSLREYVDGVRQWFH